MALHQNEADGELSEALAVFVRQYDRYRYDRWETVRSHKRKWPRSSGTKSGFE